MSSTKKDKDASSTQIKGGGRGVLSDETEEELVLLLMKLRGLPVPESKHDRQRECKRFVKRLVAQHERQTAYKAVNDMDTTVGSSSALTTTTSTTTKTSAAAASVEGKVRIELTEADFSKASSKQPFKAGSKKVLVVPRATTVTELCEQAKAKLRLKKTPNHVFVTPKKGLQVPIEADLRGIKDGCTVYVTVQQNASSCAEKSTEIEEAKKSSENEDDTLPDPLFAIKQAYRKRSSSLPTKRRRKSFKSFTEQFYQVPDEAQLPPLSEEQSTLPAASQRVPVLQAVQNHRVVIIRGATGSGKSTQVPQYLDQCCCMSDANILVTQPRRIAATALAHRVAHEMSSPKPGSTGSVVGYRVRLDHAVSDTCRIVYCTIGILLRMLVCPQQQQDVEVEDGEEQQAPLQNLSHLVIDEVHERDLNTDFCLTLLRSVLLRNKSLRVVLMSATASSDLFFEYFSNFDPHVIDIPGKMFPVEIKWLPDCERFAGLQLQGFSPNIKADAIDRGEEPAIEHRMRLSSRAAEKIDDVFVTKLIQTLITKADGTEQNGSSGTVLVFLPGKAEIESLARKIQGDGVLKDICRTIRLHSTASRQEQESAFLPRPPGKSKVILATNIAETSITIPDVKHVIDTGRVKESRFNASTRIKELVTVWTSKASAKQRCGRAGRTASGTCWRMFSEDFMNQWMPDQTPPEIIRTPLDELVLQICLLYEERYGSPDSGALRAGVCPISFLQKAPEPPPCHSLVQACQHLVEVGALDEAEGPERSTYRLTSLGYHLSRLPMDAKLGKVLLVGCILDCLDPALTVAAALSSTKSIFLSRWGRSAEDEQWKTTLQRRNDIVENGYGGKGWKGGTVKGDMIAAIAVFDAWSRKKTFKDQMNFAISNGLDNRVLVDIKGLRKEFKEYLLDARFLSKEDECNARREDARLASCCLVAGLYPNIATLMRPRREKGKLTMKGGRLITKSSEICRPSSSSFQSARVRNASETGKDAYAVFHSKHRTVGTSARVGEVFLSEVNFVSRYALMLFGGELQVRKNALIVDEWLKFKIGDDKKAGAVLIQALRRDIDAVLLKHMESGSAKVTVKQECEDVLNFVQTLLSVE